VADFVTRPFIGEVLQPIERFLGKRFGRIYFGFLSIGAADADTDESVFL
jgi:hypothetical protein